MVKVRGFFGWLLGSKTAHKETSRTYPSFVTGLSHRSPDGLDRPAYLVRLPIGTVLDLVREPDNPHDANAVAVHHDGHNVGYIPRKHDWISRSLDEGDELVCWISKIEMDAEQPSRVAFVRLQIGVVSDG